MKPTMIGIAVCPQLEDLVKRELATSPSPNVLFGYGVPILVDPRLTMGGTEVYFTWGAWFARCKEQRTWEGV